MTPQEFKAWFDGFTEAFSGTPTKAQWSRIKDRVGEIDGKQVTERIYLDRYWPAYQGYLGRQPYWNSYNIGAGGLTGVSNTTSYNTQCNSHPNLVVGQFEIGIWSGRWQWDRGGLAGAC